METISNSQVPLLPLDRVIDLKLPELVQCRLCQGIVLNPVACKNCEKVVCSTCIHNLNATKSEPICPYECTSYIERPCPKTISHILSTLNILCQYKPNGCPEIISYTKFEEHEKECNYQLSTCIGCAEKIIRKDYEEHESQCPFVLLTCDQCSTSFQRKDTDLHTSIECLRIQLQQQTLKIKQLEIKESEQQIKIDSMQQKVQEYENFWIGFANTTNQIRGMFDK
ncbi:unnamed protein product [Adineta steineri]|uniref:TRAF-type domain-containing protein n=1 Tax=Adineta steineri TaxID=433720 RepID=A0A818WJ68_9BILA|nr:unnamed protein product [Adineta steineri]CAF3726359.1 unnamed protein product [Adineta steineri]